MENLFISYLLKNIAFTRLLHRKLGFVEIILMDK